MIVRTLQRRFTVRGPDGKLHIIPGKIGTIRKTPWEVGRMYDIRSWIDKPYRSKQEHVAFMRIVIVKPIVLHSDIDECWTGFWNDFASGDGFRDWSDMRQWFEETHGLPFSGWHNLWDEVANPSLPGGEAVDL